jgi:hypothetical protein
MRQDSRQAKCGKIVGKPRPRKHRTKHSTGNVNFVRQNLRQTFNMKDMEDQDIPLKIIHSIVFLFSLASFESEGKVCRKTQD